MSQIDVIAIELFQPGVIVSFGEPQEQALHLHAAAVDEQLVQAPGPEIAQPLREHICLMEGFALWNLVKQFEDGAFR